MAIPNTETLLPKLLSRYVDSRRAELGLPDAAALPFVVGPSTCDQTYPRVYFVCPAFNSPHPSRMDLNVIVELQTHSNADEAAENILVAALRFALSDKTAFCAWLIALPVEERAGIRVRKQYITEGGMAIDDKKNVRGRRTDIAFHVITDEFASSAAV